MLTIRSVSSSSPCFSTYSASALVGQAAQPHRSPFEAVSVFSSKDPAGGVVHEQTLQGISRRTADVTGPSLKLLRVTLMLSATSRPSSSPTSMSMSHVELAGDNLGLLVHVEPVAEVDLGGAHADRRLVRELIAKLSSTNTHQVLMVRGLIYVSHRARLALMSRLRQDLLASGLGRD